MKFKNLQITNNKLLLITKIIGIHGIIINISQPDCAGGMSQLLRSTPSSTTHNF